MKFLNHIFLKVPLLYLLLWSAILEAQPYTYIALTGDHKVSKIDVSGTPTLSATITVGNTPHGIAVTPDDSKVYVTNSVSNTVSVIDASTDMVTTTINVGNYPFGIIASPDGSKIYVANNGTNTISVIDVATDNVVNTFTVGTGPHGLAFSPDGYLLYVSNRFDNTVSILISSSGSIYKTLSVGTSPRGLVSSKDGKRVYVANDGSDNVSVIDVEALTVSNFSVGMSPFDVEVSTNDQYLFVTNTGSSSITMYDVSNNNLVLTYNMPTPKGISIHPDGASFTAFSTLSNVVRTYSTSSSTLLGSFTLGANSFPAGLGNFIHTPQATSISHSFPIYAGGTGQGYAQSEIENTNTLFAGGIGQGYAQSEIENANTFFKGGIGQGYAQSEIENNNTLFAGGIGQGYASEELIVNTWTGITNQDWNTSTNWSKSTIPTIRERVQIPSGTPNDPLLPSGTLGIQEDNGMDYTCKSLFIASGASFALEDGTKIVNKGIVQIEGTLNHLTDQNDAFYNSDGAEVIIKSNGTLNIYDAVALHDLPDFVLDNAKLTIDTGTLVIADVLEAKNGSTITAVAADIIVKKVGEGSDKEGFLIDATSSMEAKGTLRLAGQQTGSIKKMIDWSNAATITADSLTVEFIPPTSLSAALAKDVDVDFGGKKVFEIKGTSSGYIYPHFQDDIEVLGSITVGASDKFYQDNGTIEINGSLTGMGEFIGTNGLFKFAGIDFCDVDIRNEFDDILIQKTNGASVSVQNNPMKIKGDLEVASGTLSVNPMTTKPDLDIDKDFKIQNGASVDFFGYNMNINLGGDYLNYNTQPFSGGFNNYGLEGVFTFDGNGMHDICAGNTSNWGDTVQFVNGGVYNMKSQLDLTNAILNIIGGKIAVDDDTMVLNLTSLNNQYGENNYIITDGSGAIKIENIGNGDTLNVLVGVDASLYTPVRIINDGTMDDFFVSAKKGVQMNGTSGSDVTNGVVDVTWNIEEKTLGGSDVELIFRWTATDEKTGFDRNTAKIWHYKNNQWIEENSDPVEGNDPYFMSLKGVSSFSPFVVANQGANLPVECLAFDAVETDNGILLNWSTATEENNDRFELERSLNGVDFNRIATLQGNGTTITRSDYEYQDATALAATTYYYRLKQIDLDGQFEYACDIITIEANRGKITTISAPFPNPTKSTTTLTITVPTTQDIQIQLINLHGQVVSEQQTTLQAGTQNLAIDLSKLPVGEYQLVVQLDGMERMVRKIIKL